MDEIEVVVREHGIFIDDLAEADTTRNRLVRCDCLQRDEVISIPKIGRRRIVKFNCPRCNQEHCVLVEELEIY